MQGLNRPDRDTLLARLTSLPGQPFSEANVGLDRDVILNFYQSAGYPDVTFDWKLSEVAERNQVNLTYVVTEGAPRYVRDVLISGMRSTRMRLVQPNVLLKAGEPLSWTKMGEMQRGLYDLGVFDKVDMAIQNQQGDTENKYVVYHLTEGHRYYVGFGLGAEVARIGGAQDSLDQPAGATGFSPRGSFEISRLNLWGLGHSLNLKTRYSTLDRRASLSYLAPRYRNVDGRNISVTALYDNTRDVRTFTAERYEASVQLSQRFSKATTALWRYTWRDVAVDQSTLKIDPLLIPTLSQAARIGMISANVVQDRRDDPVDAHRGFYNTGDLGLVYHYFGGNKNYLRFLGRSSYYKRVHGDIVLASNTQFGWIRPFSIAADDDPAQYVPLPERFYGGGSSSHRGFPDNQAGPRDLKTGFALGGNALLFHSTELRFPFLSDNITGVLFHDLGNVYSDLGSISFRYKQRDLTDFNYMEHAVGFGVRYRTPVGPIRLDLAYSLNPPVFNGLKGTYQDLICRIRQFRPSNASATSSFPSRSGRHFDMRHVLLVLAFSFAATAQNVIDRVAVVVGNQVITESEVILEARLTAFFNGQPLDLSAAQRKAAAERLVDQQLIRNEMQIGGYPMPPETDGDAALRKYRQDNYSSVPAFRAALAKYELTEDEVKRHLLWQAAAMRFTDQRFHLTIPAPPSQSADRLSQSGTTTDGVEDQMDTWLKQARAGTRIQFKKEAFQ